MQTLILRLVPQMLRPLATPARVAILAEFLRFGCVGVAGLVVDTTIVYASRHALGLYGAGALSYFIASSVTWGLNRIFTFRGRGMAPVGRQWALFVLTNMIGFVLNRSVYAVLVTIVPLAAEQPVIATSAGALAGMLVNFTLSRRIVFR